MRPTGLRLMRVRCRSGFVMLNLGYSFTGASIRCRPGVKWVSMPNGMEITSRAPNRSMRCGVNIMQKTMALIFPIKISPPRLRRSCLMHGSGRIFSLARGLNMSCPLPSITKASRFGPVLRPAGLGAGRGTRWRLGPSEICSASSLRLPVRGV